MRQITILILLLLSMTIHAADNTKQDKLIELVNVMDMDSMIDAMYSQMEIMMQNMSVEMGVKPSEQAIFDEYYSKMTLAMREEMNWQKMQPMVIDIYDKHFNETEVSEMLEFYKTPTGKAIIAKMPAIMQESMSISQTLVQNVLPKIQVIAKEFAEALNKSRSAQVQAE